MLFLGFFFVWMFLILKLIIFTSRSWMLVLLSVRPECFCLQKCIEGWRSSRDTLI